jgi:hypothetical protein
MTKVAKIGAFLYGLLTLITVLLLLLVARLVTLAF